MKLLHRGPTVEGAAIPFALIWRIWKDWGGHGRTELFALTLPVPVYRADYDDWDPMGNAFQGWFFPQWRWYDNCGEKSREFAWLPWKVKRWEDRARRRR